MLETDPRANYQSTGSITVGVPCAHITIFYLNMKFNLNFFFQSHDVEFDVHAALNELWGYVNKYYEEVK